MKRFLRRIPDGSGQLALPSVPITTHLELFLRSDIGVFKDAALTQPAANGDVVLGWQDFSGNFRHAASSFGLNNPPLYQTGITPKGRPAVRFFGAQGVNNQGQLGGTFPVGGLGSARGYTFYAWLNELTLHAAKPLSSDQIVFACEVGNGMHLIVDDWDFSAGHNVSYGVIGNLNGLGVERWAVVYHAPTDGSAQAHDLTVNGVTVSATTGLAVNLQTSYLMSGNAGGNVCFDGHVATMLVYTDQHSVAQQAQVVNWMQTVYG